MNIKTFIVWAVLTALVGCATTPHEEVFRPEGLPPTAAGIPGGVQLFWNASPSTNVGGYKVYYGQTSGNYTLSKDAGNVTTAQVTGLTEGTNYYFAVKAYDTTRTAESGYSNEISYTMPVTTPVTPPPTADFTANPTSGYASLAVNFTPVTTGTVTSWKWDFPGSYTPSVTNTTAQATTATYATPGTYSATLTVTGPGGTATKTAPNLITVAAAPITPTPTPTPPGVADSSKLGLVAAYGFEEPSGLTVADASGKRNNGTITEAVRIPNG
ncbi:MAG: PKD domain-containing protein, partial [Methylomonas sp.]